MKCKLCVLIILFLMASNQLFAQTRHGVDLDTKAFYKDKQTLLFAKDENRDRGLSIYKFDHKNNLLSHYLWLVTVDSRKGRHYPLIWDIADNWLYFISVNDHIQIYVGLHKISLDNLKEFKGSEMEREERIKMYATRYTFDQFVCRIDPLFNLSPTNPRWGPVYYDFYVHKKNELVLFYSVLNTMHVYTFYETGDLSKNEWNHILEFKIPFNEPFRLIRNDGEVFVLTETGKLFRLKGFDIEKQSEVMLAEIRKPKKDDDKERRSIDKAMRAMRLSFGVEPELIETQDSQPILNFVVDRSRNSVGLLTRQKAFELSGGRLIERVMPAPKKKGVVQQTVGIDSATAAQIPASVSGDETFRRVLDYVSTIPLQTE